MKKSVLFLVMLLLLLTSCVKQATETSTPTLPDTTQGQAATFPTTSPLPFPQPTDIFAMDTWEFTRTEGMISKVQPTAILFRGMGDAKSASAVKFYHAKNLKIAGLVSGTNAAIRGIYQQRPELVDAACINLEGEKGWLSWMDTYHHCTHHPVWREFLLERAKQSIDDGADGIFFDEWLGAFETLGPRYRGCFCGYCLGGFREYLKSKYSPEQLKALGVEDINKFDYQDFIKTKHLSLYNEDMWRVPLFQDFRDYQMREVKQFWQGFIKEVRGYASAKGKDIYFSANTANLFPHSIAIADDLDFLMSEHVMPYPPQGRLIPTIKLVRSLGKRVLIEPQTAHPELLERSDVTALMKIYTAEAYSSGGFLIVPWQLPARRLPDPWKWYDAKLEDLSSHYGFIRNNKAYYENLLPVSKIAVLYSYSSARWGQDKFEANFYGISNLLLDTHFQYDVLFAGDGLWMEDRLTSEQLSKYQVVILSGTRNLSEQQVDILLSYANSGGTLLTFGDVGTHDEKDQRIRRESLQGLLVKGKHSYGQGQLIYIEGSPGSDYFKSRNTSARESIAAVLNGLTKEAVQTDANENVAILEYVNDKDGSLALHLINYAYDTNARLLSPQNNISLQVRLPEDLQGKQIVVEYSTPDWAGVEKPKYEVSGKVVSFQVRKLDFYGVVSIRTQ